MRYTIKDSPTTKGAMGLFSEGIYCRDATDIECRIVAERDQEIERLQDDANGSNECLDMIRSRIESLGEPVEATPPYSYNDAISALVFRRLKEAGAFPDCPATVTYERVEGKETYRKKHV